MKREVGSEIKPQDADDVSRLLGALKQTEAPRNFERAVMARLTGGAPRLRRIFGMSPGLAYALPLVLIAVVGIAIFMTTRRAATSQPDVAGTSQFSASQSPAAPVAVPAVEPSIVAESPQNEHKVLSPVEPPSPTNSPKRRQAATSSGGSKDEALGQERPITSIPNAPNAPVSANRDEVISNTSVPVRDILSTLGITAEFSTGWVVRRVAANSQADHSGVKTGDIVMALGDTTLNVSTEFKGQFAAATMRIRRGGQEIKLALK